MKNVEEYFTSFVAVARNAIVILSLVKVFTAALTVGSVSISGTVEAMASVPSRVIKSLIKVAPAGESIAVAS